ncbi:MAG: sugar ABC transporter permease, partial [Chloroflexi bacterium]|nr:sugar ABC transporter permease [Chloroflexota bacterium]
MARPWVLSRRTRRTIEGYLFALPWFIGFFGLLLGPMVASLLISFTSYDMVSFPRWVGLANFARLFTDHLFWVSLGDTAYYVAASVPSSILLALALAILLNQKVRGIGIYRTLFYLPSVTSSVAVALLWTWLFDPQLGLIDIMLRAVDLPAPLWLGSIAWAKPALVLMNLWSIGNSIVLFLAGLQSIPADLYEAAYVDGAGKARSFFAITLPMLSPTIFFVLIVSIIGSSQIFTQAFVMTQGGPLNSTYFL